ncbi:hypothetical protein BH09BAC3_BH09BAC3_29370 [soil metagenome]
MAKDHPLRHSNLFTPFLRFLLVLTVVVFFHSWEPPSLAKAARIPYKSVSVKGAKVLPWKYESITSDAENASPSSIRGIERKLSPGELH